MDKIKAGIYYWSGEGYYPSAYGKSRFYQCDPSYCMRQNNMVIRFKGCNEEEIEYFYKKFESYFGKEFKDNNEKIAIAVIPSHKRGYGISGVRTLAEMLVENYDLIDATKVLFRKKEIKKLAHGGSRDVSVHLNSIELVSSEIIKDKHVLLLDDVMTTQNSLDACRQILSGANPEVIMAFAMVKTFKNKDWSGEENWKHG